MLAASNKASAKPHQHFCLSPPSGTITIPQCGIPIVGGICGRSTHGVRGIVALVKIKTALVQDAPSSLLLKHLSGSLSISLGPYREPSFLVRSGSCYSVDACVCLSSARMLLRYFYGKEIDTPLLHAPLPWRHRHGIPLLEPKDYTRN